MLLRVSYTGRAWWRRTAPLAPFELEPVVNDLDFWFPLPGWLEAEDYTSQVGVELETTTDVGGGQNVGFLDPGDVLEYLVHVTQTGVQGPLQDGLRVRERGTQHGAGRRIRPIDVFVSGQL